MSRAMLTGEVNDLLVRMTAPIVAAFAVNVACLLVDAYFVGLCGVQATAGLGFAWVLVTMVAALAYGLGDGITTAVGVRSVQAPQEGRQHVTHCLLFGLLVAALCDGLLALAGARLLALLGASAEAHREAVRYLDAWVWGLPAFFFVFAATAVLRAYGEVALSVAVVLLASLINLTLDPFLIPPGGLGLGAAGASWAAVLGYTVAALLALVVLLRRGLVTLRISPRQLLASWRGLLQLSAPGALAQVLSPCAALLVTWLLATRGDAAVAAFALGTRFDRLALMLALALRLIVVAFVAQNWAAGLRQRARLALQNGQLALLAWGLACWGALWLASGRIGPLFADDAIASEHLQSYLRIVPAGYGLAGMVTLGAAALQGSGRARASGMLIALRGLILPVPLAALGIQVGWRGFCLSSVLANLATLVPCALWLRSAGFGRALTAEAEPLA